MHGLHDFLARVMARNGSKDYDRDLLREAEDQP